MSRTPGVEFDGETLYTHPTLRDARCLVCVLWSSCGRSRDHSKCYLKLREKAGEQNRSLFQQCLDIWDEIKWRLSYDGSKKSLPLDDLLQKLALEQDSRDTNNADAKRSRGLWGFSVSKAL